MPIKLGIIAFLLSLDLITKAIFEKLYETGEATIAVIPGVFGFTYAKNTGAAFSLFSNSTALLTILSVLFVLGFFFFFFYNHHQNFWYLFGFVCIVSGAVGNMVDRIWLSYVRDFLQFLFVNFPIFNIADVLLTIGMISFAVYIFFHYPDKTKEMK